MKTKPRPRDKKRRPPLRAKAKQPETKNQPSLKKQKTLEGKVKQLRQELREAEQDSEQAFEEGEQLRSQLRRIQAVLGTVHVEVVEQRGYSAQRMFKLDGIEALEAWAGVTNGQAFRVREDTQGSSPLKDKSIQIDLRIGDISSPSVYPRREAGIRVSEAWRAMEIRFGDRAVKTGAVQKR